MKLSTVLLSSAALIVAGSAYAADLPAKKAAPAAVTGCAAFGPGFIQIPGGDTCIRISGHMAYVGTGSSGSTLQDNYNTTAGSVSSSPYTQQGEARLETDVRSNSEMGVIRGDARIGFGSDEGMKNSYDRAFVSVGGLTAGMYDGMTDIAGTNGWEYGSNLGAGPTGGVHGIQYDITAGAATISLGLENDHSETNSVLAGANNGAGRPDILIGVSTKLSGVDAKLVFASHEAVDDNNATYQGYAFVGRLGVSVGDFGAAVFGATSKGANYYVGGLHADSTSHDAGVGYNVAIADADSVGGMATGSNFGGELLYHVGKQGVLSLTADQARVSGEMDGATAYTTSRTNYGVEYTHNLGHGLSVEPAFISTNTNYTSGQVTSNTFSLRIARDF